MPTVINKPCCGKIESSDVFRIRSVRNCLPLHLDETVQAINEWLKSNGDTVRVEFSHNSYDAKGLGKTLVIKTPDGDVLSEAYIYDDSDIIRLEPDTFFLVAPDVWMSNDNGCNPYSLVKANC